jgi:hypothetical protein
MNTLIVHPFDRTTDFLEDIYSTLDATVIRGDVSQAFLIRQLEAAERIYMLGHGCPQGLLGFMKLIIDDRHVPYLEGKELVSIWCNADGFYSKHKELEGLYTGMIISEPMEARVFNVNASQAQINTSNFKLSAAVREALEVFDPKFAAEQVREFYTAEGKFVQTNGNPVIEYNKHNIYSTYQIVDQPRPEGLDDEPDYFVEVNYGNERVDV